MKADLEILLRGGSSMPLSEVAELIRQALTSRGLNVQVEESSDPEWKFGWDGEPMDESVLIRRDPERR